ncbi:signal peptide peptidase SppA [Kozakia baliensis]|uniref:signal peptide peptidase SppA n=1 Tax=Kozakia baliensis TaxID=153496 RepID=UPI00068DEE6E|nr:signal peptide peptidase SppA [Kozakia baliensis]
MTHPAANEFSDGVVVQEKLRRRLLIWRIAAVLAFSVALLTVGLHRYNSSVSKLKPHIVRVAVDGIIGNDLHLLTRAIDKAASDRQVRGLLLVVDSPGGGVTGGEELHDAVARFKQHKPVVVSMLGTAASAGYMISVPASRIFALSSTITGSIGVIMERPDVSGLLGKTGINVHSITSGAMKDQTQPFVALRPDGQAMLQGVVDDLFNQFVEMVADGRHLPIEKVKSLADGRPYTGRQALPLGLIDQIGNEDSARSWLKHELHVADDFPVLPLRSSRKADGWETWLPRRAILNWVLGPSAVNWLDHSLLRDGLDAPIAILQP